MKTSRNHDKDIQRATATAKHGHAAFMDSPGRVSRRHMRMWLKRDGMPAEQIPDALLSMGYPEPVQAKKGGAK